MLKLLKKEFSLCLHPASVIFLLFGAFVFIPNYPYEVMFFFNGLGIFFICLTARENGDLAFSCTLPVRKKHVAYARIVMALILQGILLLGATLFTLLKWAVLPTPNLAGMDANVTFLGMGLLLMGTFNLIFFPTYFSNPNKVGKPFILASTVIFLLIFAEIACCYALPLFSQHLDSYHSIGLQLIALAVGAVLYACFTALCFRLSGRNFEKFDL